MATVLTTLLCNLPGLKTFGPWVVPLQWVIFPTTWMVVGLVWLMVKFTDTDGRKKRSLKKATMWSLALMYAGGVAAMYFVIPRFCSVASAI